MMTSWFEIGGKSIIEYLMTSRHLENYFLIIPYRVPHIVYYLTFVSVLLGWSIQLYRKGFKQSIRYLFLYSLVDYVFLLVCSTCIFRDVTETRNFCLIPFWSYREIMNGTMRYIIQDLMNVVVFLPIGFLSPLSFNHMNIKRVLLLGCSISIIIELAQLLFKTGLCEFDDLFHNSLGVAVGYGLYVLVGCMVKFLNMCGIRSRIL